MFSLCAHSALWKSAVNLSCSVNSGLMDRHHVLVLAGIKIIFLSVAAVDNILMDLVVAKESRTFFSFPYSADEQVWREHSQAARPSWPMEIFHIMEVLLSL